LERPSRWAAGLIRRFDFAQPDGLAGDLLDAPSDQVWRFGFLGHARRIAHEFDPAEKPGRFRVDKEESNGPGEIGNRRIGKFDQKVAPTTDKP
jgi:hypothetical protein